MRRIGVMLTGLALSLGSAAGAQQAPKAEQAAADWSAIARGDILSAYDTYVANHPGMHDPDNASFPAQLARARDAGLAQAANARDEYGYRQALGAFTSVLGDGHAQLAFKRPPPGSAPIRYDWPGFVTAWRGDRLLVHHATAGSAVTKGARITACEGMPIRDFLQSRLLIQGFRPGEGGQWWYWAPQVFIPPSNLTQGRARSCTFVASDGREQVLPLSWSPAPEDVTRLVGEATDGERTPIGLTEPRPGVFLLGLQTFQPSAEEIVTYRTMFEAMKARHGELAGARAVVIDLRYNNGGSSSWSKLAADALWGEAQVDKAVDDYARDVQIWWRASPANAAYVAGEVPKMRERGATEGADYFAGVATGLSVAAERGEPFYVEEDEEETSSTGAVGPNGFNTPVYVITPGRCGSACLDALDVFTRFPNVKLIGAPTSADTTYMDVRVEDLPSGKGRIVIPNKVWRGRPRKSGEVYQPHIPVHDLDWSTATFLDEVEKDLDASRRPRR